MEKNTQKLKPKGGFSMLEMIIVITIIGIIGAVVSVTMGNTIKSSRKKAKDANARVMNNMIDEVRSMGGRVEVGSAPDIAIDTSDIGTVIASLTKNPGLEIDEITFKIKPTPNVESYILEKSEDLVLVVPLKNSKSP